MNSERTTIGQIAEWIGGRVEGDPTATIRTLASFDSAEPDTLTFAADAKRLDRLADCQAAAVIVPDEAGIVPDDARIGNGTTLIRVLDVERAVAELLRRFAPPADVPPAGVHPAAMIDATAHVAPDVAIGANVMIGAGAVIGPRCVLAAHVVIGRDVTLGDDCVILPGAVIEARSVLGNRVHIGPNSVVGAEGFGYIHVDGAHQRLEHTGNVVIEDDVDLGACVCVDRAKFGSTRIGRGAKIDNLVQIAHNVQIGEGCLLAAQVGVAGSAKLGRFVVVGGSTGIRDNITIGDGVQVMAYAAVANDIEPGQTIGGIPARPVSLFRRMLAAEAKLPTLVKRIKALESRIDELG